MSIVNLTCISSTPTAKNDGHIIKLQGKVVKQEVTPFGTKTQTNQETYYMKMQNAVAVGTKGDLDLSKFRIDHSEFTLPSGENAGKVVQLKWLFLK